MGKPRIQSSIRQTSEKHSGVIRSRGLVIRLDQTLERSDWPKVNYLMRKGYSREEAVAFLPRLVSGEIRIDRIPVKPRDASDKEKEKK
jgi:hypothetical protein